ncbi:hypothetical protein [Acetobacter persici]|uniref:hypothetical protein n=1 Tax=Acetobacter persici TaxID=1076596 RepID=UPI001BA74C75|nr:hypothetical protein [Acetobacter persici]MBS1016907.1 hypothetical protein [Acetobacter persici]
MSVGIDQAQSNGPVNVLIAGSAPGTKGDKGNAGIGIQDIALSGDGLNLLVTLTDSSVESVPLNTLLDVVQAHSSDAIANAVGDYERELSGKLDASAVYADPSGLVRFMPPVIGTLPTDVTLNGGVYIAGATALPAGLSADPATGMILTDGSTYYPNTINNVGVLCAAAE